MPKSLPPVCPSCGNASLKLIGYIPPSNVFAGRELMQVLDGGRLYNCERCSLYFRWPRLSKEELDKLYETGDPHAWENDQQTRSDWMIAASWLQQDLHEGGSILDVGCSTGRFLAEILKDEIRERYGIEINSGAAGLAKKRGIHIIGSDIFDLDLMKQKKGGFSTVVAFDIIEHIEDPLSFLETCSGLLSQDGRIIISTGNTRAKSWRYAGSRYWYCTIPEHISFINERWCQYAAGKIGLKVVRINYFSHASAGVIKNLRELALNGLYIVAPYVFRAARRAGLGGRNASLHPEIVDYPPGWMAAKDHLIVEFKRS